MKPFGDAVDFQDIAYIKFGDSKKETNFCDTSVFSYSVDTKSVVETSHNLTFTLVNKQNPTLNENLVFAIQMMDDEGTLRVAITTESDHNNVAGKKKFRPEEVVANTQYRGDPGSL